MLTLPTIDKSSVPPPMRRELIRAQNFMVSCIAHYRALRGAVRPAPDFIIIGGQKCGTTYLYDELVKHPTIAPALTKEVHFFDLNYHKGADWYRAHFPVELAATADGEECQMVTGEASPYYIYHPHAPRRIAEVAPHAKLILLIRNPVSRAYSHYQHEVRMGYETRPFHEAIADEQHWLDEELDRMLNDEHYYSFRHYHYTYLSRGIYVDQLRQWFACFPREQLLILKSEEFYKDVPGTMQRVMDFVGVAPWQPEAFGRNPAAPYAKMDPALRQELLAYYAPHNRRLSEYLGMEIAWDR
jgi:hypothetical protein